MSIFDNLRSYHSLAIDQVMDVFNSANHQDLDPINFGKGMSSFNPLAHVEVELTNDLLMEHVGYGDINGLMGLRKAISQYYQEHFNYDLNPERICITDGASGALMMAMAMLLEKGDEIILPESCYPAYSLSAQVFAATACSAPMGPNLCIDIEQLPQLMSPKTKAILVNSPSNPHGAVLQMDELATIADLGIPVIFDEVYQALSLVDEPIPSAIELCDRHFIVSSLSKSLSIAGFRVGYLIVPEQHIQLMTNVKAVLNMCTSLPSQLIAEKLLHHWDELLGKHRQLLRHNWSIFEQTAHRLDLQLLTRPKAGFFGLVDVSQWGDDSMALSLKLAKDHALSTIPGIDFQNENNDFLRLNFACPSYQIGSGLARISKYLNF